MTTIEDILNAANQLAANGKKPSVALIKAKLGAGAPLPLIISALKSWSYEPDKLSLENNDKPMAANESTDNITDSEPAGSSELTEQLQLALQPLRQELAEIKHLLQQLVASKNNN